MTCEHTAKPLAYGSLFAGIGGIDLGLERAGMECRWQVEIDDYATRVLEKHWPDVRRWRDVRTFPPEPIDDWRVDLIAGGDPCQANSAAGTSRATSLGSEFVRVVNAIRPRLVLRENPTHTRRDAPWPWWRMRDALESIGYAVLPFRLRACCVGAYHRRDRLFLFAEISNTNRDGLERGTRQAQRMETMESPRLVEVQHWPPIPSGGGFDSRAGISSYVDCIRCLGNAVVPAVAEWIGRRIMESTP